MGHSTLNFLPFFGPIPIVRFFTPFELMLVTSLAGPNKFTNENLEGKWSLIFMGFASCPDMCPMTMKQMAKTSEFLELEMPDAKEKISFTIVSVDPDRDTPEAILK